MLEVDRIQRHRRRAATEAIMASWSWMPWLRWKLAVCRIAQRLSSSVGCSMRNWRRKRMAWAQARRISSTYRPQEEDSPLRPRRHSGVLDSQPDPQNPRGLPGAARCGLPLTGHPARRRHRLAPRPARGQGDGRRSAAVSRRDVGGPGREPPAPPRGRALPGRDKTLPRRDGSTPGRDLTILRRHRPRSRLGGPGVCRGGDHPVATGQSPISTESISAATDLRQVPTQPPSAASDLAPVSAGLIPVAAEFIPAATGTIPAAAGLPSR